MKRSLLILLIFSLPGNTQEPDPARTLVDKAIQAAGGEAALTKARVARFKMKGTFHGIGQPLPVESEVIAQLPERAYQRVAANANGMAFTSVQVCDGDKGWRKLNDQVMDMTKEELAESKEQLHVDYVAGLTALKDPAYKLTLAGQGKARQVPVIGVKVSREGFRDVVLYFDQDKGLLRKVESRLKAPGDRQFTQETLYDDFRPVSGVLWPYKVSIRRDGKDFLDAESSDVNFLDKVDDAVFAKPG